MKNLLIFAILMPLYMAGSSDLAYAAGKTEKGTCLITSGSSAHSKFVTLKCALNSAPGFYVIRSTIFERDDAAEFRKIVRLSGIKMTCDLTEGSTNRESGMETTQYTVDKCRQAR